MENMSQFTQQIDEDQRKKPTAFLNFYSFQTGQIKILGSSDAQYGYYMDRYSPRSLLAFFAVIFFSILDGHFTLNLIGKGVSELNPLMDILIRTNIPTFWFCKIYLTVLGLYLLLIHKNFHFPGMRIGVKHIVLMIIGIYAIIVSGELFILSQL